MKYLKYFWTVCKHRWFVSVEAYKLGIPLLGLIHDWSKFLPAEFFPYAEYFNGGYERGKQPQKVKDALNVAWLHHQRWNKHHWQSWVLHNDNAECPFWAVGAFDPQTGPWNISVYPKINGTITYDGAVCHIAEFSDNHIFDEVLERYKTTKKVDDSDWQYYPNDISLGLAEHVAREMSRLPKALPMPDRYRREMLADWRGAGRAYGNPNTRAWYIKNADGIILHPETRKWIEDQLEVPEGSRYKEWFDRVWSYSSGTGERSVRGSACYPRDLSVRDTLIEED